jgi:uncharacterized protein YciI
VPYLIETYDKPNHSDVRSLVRARHPAFLDANSEKLLACGAKLTDAGEVASGGIYILAVEDRGTAEQFHLSRPVHAGPPVRGGRHDPLAQSVLQLRELPDR